ncbi:MAG TPA: bifunctional glutamate N-acetyltransferase/amino-acid acetyltransferase ArgJ [Candidatus Omnitrophota bacterium]|nr:bifunctional glutamate N-acetyltransferase/amino-acid acetyltransferase ArgJ [Candidatus Omnitrophota bacterium]
MEILPHAVLPQGFAANAVACGLKRSGKPDLALIYSLRPAHASCMFTTNKIIAAPVILCKENLRKNRVFHAVIANSGNANCFTGSAGLADARKTARETASILGIRPESVLVFSTGIIGKRIDVRKIARALPALCAGLSPRGLDAAKKAIMTTDTFAKAVAVRCMIAGRPVTISGIAKGSGMIGPNMATMLAFIMTDADISQNCLDTCLKDCVKDTFNCVTVDGCMSTNDSVAVLANGQADNKRIKGGRSAAVFAAGLHAVCLALAKMLAQDGEGATKFITINVSKARSFEEARTAALAIANSPLFKTAVYGKNPNFGRIACAVGASGIDVSEKGLKVHMGPLNRKDVVIDVGLSRGKAACTVYTSDLTPEYIKINAEYN